MPTPALQKDTPGDADGAPLIDERECRATLLDHWRRLLERFGDFGVPYAEFEGLVLSTLRSRLTPSDGRRALGLLEKMALADLYLARGCACRAPRAWRAFEDQYGPALDRLAVLFSTSTITANDARQELLAGLFGGRDGQSSRFQTYRGISSLEGWLRVAMRRIVIDLHRKVAWRPLPGVCSSLELGGLPDPTPPPESRMVDTRAARALVTLAEEAIAALPSEDRQLLLRHHRDAGTYEEIGREFGVHTATAHRRLQRIRADLARTLLRGARDRLALLPADIYVVRDLMADLFAFSDPTGTEPGT